MDQTLQDKCNTVSPVLFQLIYLMHKFEFNFITNTPSFKKVVAIYMAILRAKKDKAYRIAVRSILRVKCKNF